MSMLHDDDVVLVLCSVPDMLLAKRIAHELVEDGLAACVNLGAVGLSIYRWQDEIESSEEVPLAIKTTQARQTAVITALTRLHPYEVPEIIVLPVIGGMAAYLDWVRAATGTAPAANRPAGQ
jgi:periplasmic divalent cation tolerance protein